MLKKGFTVLEVLVVIALMLIVLAIVLPNLPGVKDRGTKVSAITDHQRVALAMDRYYAQCGQYPTSNSQQLDLTAGNGCSGGEVLQDFLTETVTTNHKYIPFSSEQYSGNCDVGYMFAIEVELGSDLLEDDHDYYSRRGRFPYHCETGSNLLGDDSVGWYDFVHPESYRF